MSAFIDAYRAAEREMQLLTRDWNALPTPEARLASGISFDAARTALNAAAVALIGDAGPRHKIEQMSKVYLVLDPATATWVIDGGTDHGVAMEGYNSGASCDGCECNDSDECQAVAHAADHAVSLPGARDLSAMLTAELA